MSVISKTSLNTVHVSVLKDNIEMQRRQELHILNISITFKTKGVKKQNKCEHEVHFVT